MAGRYGLGSKAEAAGYWEHPVLGTRLEECCQLLLAPNQRMAQHIFGSPDDAKLRSSMKLFAAAVSQEPVFHEVLQRHYQGEHDARTLALL